MLAQTDDKTQLEGITGLKDIMKPLLNSASGLDGIIQELLVLDVLSMLVEILKDDKKDAELHYQATWLLINIACGSSQKVEDVLKFGVIDALTQLIDLTTNLDEPKEKFVDVALQCVWALGNVATDSMEHRDACLDKDAAHKVVALLKKHKSSNDKLQKMGVWGLCRLVDKKPAPFWNQIQEALPYFISVIQKGESESCCKYALWGIFYISNSYLVNVFDSGCIPIVLTYLQSPKPSIAFPALKVLANLISSSRDAYTDEILKHDGFLARVFELFTSPNEEIKIYAAMTLSNIAAGTPNQIEKLISKPKYIDNLGEGLKNEDDRLKYQASCAIANLVSRATNEQIENLVQNCHYLDHISALLKEKHLDIYQRNVIEPIQKILKSDTKQKIIPIFKSTGLVEQMRQASHNLTHDMKHLNDSMLRQYFSNNVTGSLFSTATNSVPLFGSGPAPAATIATTTAAATTDSTDNKGGVSKVDKAPKAKKIQKPPKAPKKATSPKVLKARAAASPNPKRSARLAKKAQANGKAIRRTTTMQQVIDEAKDLTEGVTGRTRSSKALLADKVKKLNQKKADGKDGEKDSNVLASSKKIKRTRSMKQTLGEAKRMMKQIDAVVKAAKKQI